MNKKNYISDLEPVAEETLEVFEEAVFVPSEQVEPVEEVKNVPEVMTAVILRCCPVVSYNSGSKIVVYNDNGKLIQSNMIPYDGRGYVEVE